MISIKLWINILNNTNDVYTNKTFTYYSNNKFDFEEDTYDKKLNRFETKLNEIKDTFLKRDKNYITTDNDLLRRMKERKIINIISIFKMIITSVDIIL